MLEENTIHESNDLIADIREEAADFDAGVQNLFDELESVRAALQQKEVELEEKEDRLNQRATEIEAIDGRDSASNSELYEKFTDSFARVEKEFATAVTCMELIPEMCDSEDALQSQIEQLQQELTQSKALRVELEQDFTAERERSARLEASLAAAEQAMVSQREAFEAEFTSLRNEIRGLSELKNVKTDSANDSKVAEPPKAESTETNSAHKPETDKPAESQAQTTNSSRRSKRSRRRKKR